MLKTSLFVDELSDPIELSPRASQIHEEQASQSQSQRKQSQSQSQRKQNQSHSQCQKPLKFSSREWREANKATHKKEDILGEMIIETAVSLDEALDAEYFNEVFQLPTRRKTYSDIPLISWKRKATALYNQEEDMFVPCDAVEVCERVFVLYYEGSVLVDKITNNTLCDDLRVAKDRARLQDPLATHHFIVMVCGLKEHLRKLQNVEDRIYRDKMLQRMSQTDTDTPVASQKRRRTEQTPKITATEAQKAVYAAEVHLAVTIFPVRTCREAIDWLFTFTHTIGSSWYDKSQRYPTFTNMGTIRLGSDRRSTFMEMVKKFNLMTHPRAEKLYEFYSTAVALYNRYSVHESLGTVGGKNIVPPSTNIAMRNVFTADDPNQVIYD